MNLPEKILYCRKRAGLSQEQLAEQIGVSRQAVSKWETGEATPELGKLRALALAFGVTADWLMSDGGPDEPLDTPQAEPQPTGASDIPGFLGRMQRKYGRRYGVYLAAGGAVCAGIGELMRYLPRKMFARNLAVLAEAVADDSGLPASVVYNDIIGTQLNDTFSRLAANSPVAVFGTVILVFGLLLFAAGIMLAIVLKKKESR